VAPALDLSLESMYFRGGLLPADRVDIGSDCFTSSAARTIKASIRRSNALHSGDRFNLIGGIEAAYDHEELLTPRRINQETGQTVLNAGGQSTRVSLTNLGAYVSSNLKLIDPCSS